MTRMLHHTRKWKYQSPSVFGPVRANDVTPFNSGMMGTALLLVVAVSLCAVFMTGCDCRSESASVAPEPDRPTQEDTQPTPPAYEEVTATMRVVTLQGQPLPGMKPIATHQPNAFDEPVATGRVTTLDGESRIRFPGDQKLALRAWDPELRYFPNNFYEALPNTGSVTDTLVISMVEAARIEAVLILPDGRPAENDNAGLMLFHPVHGPWWPAEANTEERGAVVFPRVPPGQFVLRLKVASGPTVEIPETYIAPGETTHLGLIYLQ